MTINLLNDDIKNQHFYRQRQTDCRTEENRRNRPYDRTHDRYPFRHSCQQADDHRIGNPHDPHAAKGKRRYNTAQGQLATDIGTQYMLYFIKQHVELQAVLYRI